MWTSFWTHVVLAPVAGLNWWEVANSELVSTVVSTMVGFWIATRVQRVAEESKVATEAKQDAEREESRLTDDLEAAEVDKRWRRDNASTNPRAWTSTTPRPRFVA
jgi:phosphate/sulfate permease